MTLLAETLEKDTIQHAIEQLSATEKRQMLHLLLQDKDNALTLDQVFQLAYQLNPAQQSQLVERLQLLLANNARRASTEEKSEAAWKKLQQLEQEMQQMPAHMPPEEALLEIRGAYVHD